MNPEIKELIEAHEAYEKLLVDELVEIVSIASVHGWKSSRALVGKKARDRIAAARKAVEVSPTLRVCGTCGNYRSREDSNCKLDDSGSPCFGFSRWTKRK